MRGLAFGLLWWILAEGRLDGWLLGGVAVAAATWTSLKLQPPGKLPMRLAGLVRFLRFFLWNSLRGGFQVAAMALRGRAALRPGIIELRVMLPPGEARILLVNALGLMPGTLGVDLNDTSLRLHVLDDSLPVVAETRALETSIAGLFGEAP
ncbi:Na+/H+ antiporter subunit E [Sulfuritalea sp.]|uniref:Na+/H+ antiporter subunit E n=1 Tax=Sulfuritalea sp. TaxID=2480090 RepID=UPI001ACB4038|nr:Na+/H+ antiporter subunit E [Sulfuritalea sp.]MBN8473871.1 Na+/H+ antiporter subunit E [Sulfuritalea sp.]